MARIRVLPEEPFFSGLRALRSVLRSTTKSKLRYFVDCGSHLIRNNVTVNVDGGWYVRVTQIRDPSVCSGLRR
ncbi:MAG TPA: hypothetical protein VKB49_05465 [Candidatus Sulfotelmatobacter sp.]|nr:hypothetical protein [Candidatus Sulfotelmatobacter sp.]